MMRWTNKQIWMAVLGLGAVATVLATGVLGASETQQIGPVGSGAAAVIDPPGRDPGETPARSPGPTVITLGELDPPSDTGSVGAPFDPCTVIGWTDLPTAVRPAADTKPSPHQSENGEDFILGCRFDNSGPTVTDDHAAPGGETAVFTVTVLWGTTPPMSLNPSSYPGATATTVAGRAGVQRPSTDPHGHPMCTGLMPVTTGVAGATVTNSRFPHADPCTVAAAALTAIATKVP